MPDLREGLSLDDVMLLPRRSDVTVADTTLDCKLSSRLSLHVPFIASARQRNADFRLASTIARAGGVGCVPLFSHVEDQAHEVRKVKELPCQEEQAACDAKGRPLVAALLDFEHPGLLEWISSLAEVSADLLMADLPQADRLSVLHLVEAVKRDYDWMPLMIGNVETRSGAKDLIDAGADVLLVGSGVSSYEEATKISGIGAPELSGLMEVEDVASLYGRPIVCNMGISTPAGIIKALAAGATAVILGDLLPETAAATVTQLGEMLRRGLSYVGARSITELHEKAEFIRVHAPFKG